MQIVIDIPEDELTDDEIQDCIQIAEANFSNVTLIKGEHGDLIDRDELKKYAGWYNLATDKSIHAVLTKEIDWVKPVIERTKEGENE